jgi:hypothetical protein
MIFFSDEYADLFNHSSNKQTSSSAGMSDKEIDDMVGNPYGHTPGQESVSAHAPLTTAGQLDMESTGTLFSSYGEKSIEEILGNAMNHNASIAASSSQSLEQMTNFASSFTSSGRGGGGDSDAAVVVAEDGSVSGGIFQTERFGEVYTPSLGGRLSTVREAGSAPAVLAGRSASKSLSEIRQSREARRRGEKPSRAKRNLNMGAKNYTFDARSNEDYFG